MQCAAGSGAAARRSPLPLQRRRVGAWPPCPTQQCAHTPPASSRAVTGERRCVQARCWETRVDWPQDSSLTLPNLSRKWSQPKTCPSTHCIRQTHSLVRHLPPPPSAPGSLAGFPQDISCSGVCFSGALNQHIPQLIQEAGKLFVMDRTVSLRVC